MGRTRSDLDQLILQFIADYYEKMGYPPTYREVAEAVHSAHSNVWQAIRDLREGGFLRETPPTSTARCLMLSDSGRQRVLNSTATHAIHTAE